MRFFAKQYFNVQLKESSVRAHQIWVPPLKTSDFWYCRLMYIAR